VRKQEVAAAKGQLAQGLITAAQYNEVVRENLALETNRKARLSTCPTCGAEFATPALLQAHFDQAHGAAEVHATNVFACPDCLGVFADRAALKAHAQAPRGPDGKCEPALHAAARRSLSQDEGADLDDLGGAGDDLGGAGDDDLASQPGAAAGAAGAMPLRKRPGLRGAGLAVMAATRSQKAEEVIFDAVARRVSQKGGALAEARDRAMRGDNGDGEGANADARTAAPLPPEVSDTDLVRSFANLLISLRDPEYLRAFVLERGGITALATMSAHIVADARARAKVEARQARKLLQRTRAREARHEARDQAKRAKEAEKFLGLDGDPEGQAAKDKDDEWTRDDDSDDEDYDVDGSDDDDFSDDDSDLDDEEGGGYGGAPVLLSVNEVTLQHCVLKAVLTVLDSGPGLQWVLGENSSSDGGGGGSGGGSAGGGGEGNSANEDAFASIFENIQASGQRQHMGKLYAIATSLCYHPQHGAKGQRLFMRCLDAADASRPDRPRFDAVCRLLCDAETSWAVKLEAMGALNTLVIIGASEEERLDLRAEVRPNLGVFPSLPVKRARLERSFPSVAYPAVRAGGLASPSLRWAGR
jgi:hypothetical protein